MVKYMMVLMFVEDTEVLESALSEQRNLHVRSKQNMTGFARLIDLIKSV